MTAYEIRQGWDIDVADETGAWRRIGTNATLPCPAVPTGYGALDVSEYTIRSRYMRQVQWPSDGDGRRVFLRFDGLLHAATVVLDDKVAGSARGGYTPFSFEVTGAVPWGGSSVLAVELDARQRIETPPFGRPSARSGWEIDFHTFAGISRPPTLEIVPPVHVAAVRTLPRWGSGRVDQVDVTCFVDWPPPGSESGEWPEGELDVALVQDDAVLARNRAVAVPGQEEITVPLSVPAVARMWWPEAPALATVHVGLAAGAAGVHRWEGRTGLRVAEWESDGLRVNGRKVALRGLNRHELYPYLGPCAPAGLHRLDARILKEELGCNVVRAAHYPHSPDFLDACDEAGLMVFEETPGWGYLGNRAWRETVCRDVAAMVRRDWNHPSIILWGIRCNETPHDDALYRRTTSLAHDLDPSRATGGVRRQAHYDVPIVEDVACYNEYREVPTAPNHQPYLVTEFVGAITPPDNGTHVYHRAESIRELEEQGLRHARFYDGLCVQTSVGAYAGGIGWAAFDYQSPSGGAARRWRDVKTPGVSDIFRVPKLAAGFYSSQRDRSECLVLDANFTWDELALPGSDDGPYRAVWVWTNADSVRATVDDVYVASGRPASDVFPHLPHPPVRLALPSSLDWQGELLLEAIAGDEVLARCRYSPRREADVVLARADASEIAGDGCDAVRVVVGVTDRFGHPRFTHQGALEFSITGPARIVGPGRLSLSEIGGIGATFVAGQAGGEGTAVLTVSSQELGSATATISVRPYDPEKI